MGRALTAKIKIRVEGDKAVITNVQNMSDGFNRSLVEIAQQRASILRDKLRARTAAEYNRSGTGRFSRGLNTRVLVSKPGGRTQTTIQVTMINYRENKFLTEMVGGGFTDFPVKAYYIFARGVTDPNFKNPQVGSLALFDPHTSEDINKRGFKRSRAIFGRQIALSRLKVPFTGFTTTLGRFGRESLVPIDAEPGQMKSEQFYYPLWVHHPEINDVVTPTILEEGELLRDQAANAARLNFTARSNVVVRFNPNDPGSGINFTTVPITVKQTARGNTTNASVQVPASLIRLINGG